MPNWCMNTLTITGPKDVLDEIAETGLSLAKLVPVPEELTKFEKITPVPKSEKKARADMMAKYGVDTQFDWQVKFWGTKWDIGERSVTVEPVPNLTGKKPSLKNPKEYEIQATFDSAWSPPVAAFEMVYNRYKDRGLNIMLEYFEPGCSFLGKVTTDGGVFEDQCREYKTADELEEAVRELDHWMGQSELEYMREREEEERAYEERKATEAAPLVTNGKVQKATKKSSQKKVTKTVTAKKTSKMGTTKKPAVPLRAAKTQAAKKPAKRTK